MSELQQIIDSSENLVFFGGAGVSTESGIRDFRSADGLYTQSSAISPETLLSHAYFIAYPDKYYEFHRKNMVSRTAKPNAAHYKLAELERAGRLKAVITQNIDGLHQAAGSKTVYELHGSVLRNYCMKCHKLYDLDYIMNAEGVPHCECGGVVKPDVVLYEEALDQETLDASMMAIARADTLIIGGTSLTVYPAAGLIRFFRGKNLVLINRDETPMDARATLVLHESVGETLDKIIVR